MGTFSIWHWLVVLAIILVLFGGRGKISQLMGDFGKGLNSFKKNLKQGEGEETDTARKSIEQDEAATSEPAGKDQAAKT